MSDVAIAVLVAGGGGSRFQSAIPKQFMPLLGKPLLAHTLSVFERSRAIESIVLVLPAGGFADYEQMMRPFHGQKPLRVVPGGTTRQGSTLQGLRAIEEEGDDTLVAVHDGARPLVDEPLVARVVSAAAEAGAAIAGVPVVETLKEVADDGRVLRTLDRTRFCRAQTPQCFRLELLRRGFERALADGFEGTDESAVVERLGATIRVVAGSERNIKVTTPEDWARVELALKAERSP